MYALLVFAGLLAPVYYYTGSDIELLRVGTITYEAPNGTEILYCIADVESDLDLECVVRTKDDRLKIARLKADNVTL